MTEIRELECDCGCGVTSKPKNAGGWFILQQSYTRNENVVRLQDDKSLHFVNLDHLYQWVKKAVPVARKMVRDSETSPNPRGPIVDSDLSLCI